jgi:hypothetical protein
MTTIFVDNLHFTFVFIVLKQLTFLSLSHNQIVQINFEIIYDLLDFPLKS